MNTPVRRRVFIACLFHETHTFLPGRTVLSDCQIAVGTDLLNAAGDVSPLGGVLEVAQSLNWDVWPGLDIRMNPSAMVADEVVEFWWQQCHQQLQEALKEGIDGIYLVLHGAMAANSFSDVEGEILERLRVTLKKEVPIGGVTDLHANFSPRMALFSNSLLTYRCNPHTDARETAIRAAQLLDEQMTSGCNAWTFFRQLPILWPPTGTGTANAPMQLLLAEARAIELANSEIMAINIHAGYSYADVEDAGLSFSVVAKRESADTVYQAFERLSQIALSNRELGNIVNTDFESQLPAILQAVNGHGTGPVVIAEPSDNIGGGAPGDGTALLQLFIQYELGDSAIVINDPQAVVILESIEMGSAMELKVGGQSHFRNAGPIELKVELLSRSNGEFDLEDIHSHMASGAGLHIKMGPCATVRHRLPNGKYVYLLITSNKTAPFDLGQLRSQGIEPERMALIGVKAAIAHRQVYEPIAKAMFSVETPGPCGSDLRLLPFKNVRRPIFPLDKCGVVDSKLHNS